MEGHSLLCLAIVGSSHLPSSSGIGLAPAASCKGTHSCSISQCTHKKMLTREGIRGAAKPEFSSLPSPPCKSSHCERSPPTPEKSHTNGAAAHAGLEAGAACARASAPNPLPPTCALPGGGGARPSGLAGRRAGSPQLPSPCVWGEGAWAASGTFHSQREPGGGGRKSPEPRSRFHPSPPPIHP